ncbi:MAG: hypothetical protein V3V31_05015 [Methylococcales bacterium]
MATETTNSPYHQDPSYTRSKAPGILERLGVKYYRRLAKQAGIGDIENTRIHELASDEVMVSKARAITLNGIIIAFAIGVLTTMVTVWVEWKYQHQLDTYTYYALQGSITLLMILIEFAVLFWIALVTVHDLSHLTGHHLADDDPLLPGDDAVPNLLARAALEIPDPVVHYLGIDPLKFVSTSRLFLVGLLYKAKVIMTSVAAKFLFRRLTGKAGLRMGFTWIAAPVTGIWDAVVLYRVAREARLRLFGHRLAQHLIFEVLTPQFNQKLSPKAKEGAIRAVATMMVLTQNYHPNMLMLLSRFCQTFDAQEDCTYDDWQAFLNILNEVSDTERYFLLDLLSIAAAFDGQLSRLERRYLPEAFGNLTETYMQRIKTLKKLLLTGQLHAAKQLCKLNFQPG